MRKSKAKFQLLSILFIFTLIAIGSFIEKNFYNGNNNEISELNYEEHSLPHISSGSLNKTYFNYSKVITIDSSKVVGSTDLTNFSFLLSIYDSNLRTEVQSNGNDIAFSDGTNWLDHEIELFKQDFNGTHARLVAWIRIPSLSTSTDTNIYMYYGNSTMASQQNPEGVWDSNYYAVYHMNQDPSSSSVLDSTANNYDLTPGSGFTSAHFVDGIVGKAIKFNSQEDEYLNISSGFSNPTSSLSLEMWFKPQELCSPSQPLQRYFTAINWPYYGQDICFRYNSDPSETRLRTRVINNTGSGSSVECNYIGWNTNQFYHFVMTWEGGSVGRHIHYLNGALNRNVTDADALGTASPWSGFIIGADIDCSDPSDVVIEEFRITSNVRSSDWFETEYNNQKNPYTFYSIGSQYNVDITPPVIVINSPNDNDLLGSIAPNFNVIVNDDSSIDSKWYRLLNGTATTVNTTFSTNETINQARWAEMGNGTVTIQFFANDIFGNKGYSEITVRKDIFSPIIKVNSPIDLNLFGYVVPTFNVEIQDVNSIDSMWYTLNNGLKTFFTENGTISQACWEECGNGSVSIKFYANDSLGNQGFLEVIVRKDIISPIIIINTPEFLDLCGRTAPSYDVRISDPNGIASMWYTLNNGSKTFFTTNGTFSQTLWDEFENGHISIRFYANDSLGNEGSSEVIIEKDINTPTVFPWWLIIIIAVPLGLALLIVSLKKSKKKNVQVVIIDKELDKLKEKRSFLEEEAKSAIKKSNYLEAAEIYEECGKISYELYQKGDKLEQNRYKNFKDLELEVRSKAEAIPLRNGCINKILTKFFDENEIKYYSNPQVYPDSQETINGLILNDKRYLQNRFTNFEDGPDLANELKIDSEKVNYINAIQILYTKNLTVDEIVEYCQKYQNPEMILFIVGLEWLAYHYDDILILPQDKTINYPENIKTINLNLFSRIFQLTSECQKELNKIVNLNDNFEALKKLYESSKITLHDTAELKEELKQKGWFFLI
ncbi:MAG: DUF2341 domain-containing protein [Promethearchaeota archaeon]